MKFKVGDEVEITENNNNHQFDIGEVVEILKVCKEDSDYLAWDGRCNVWWVDDTEIKLIRPAK